MKRTLSSFIALAWLLGGALAMATEPMLGDLRFERKTTGDEDFPPAIFSHWKHRVKFKCYVCHNKTMGFEMKLGSAAITMSLIDQGKYCGACHNGTPGLAFGVSFDYCARCHKK
ncbi:cytochrome c3 family protein [Rhodoferax sp.]|uniref:cytochrome c3 family protein n=1 Tax=Rhodoferax sp. TaxID=50421 RepID=UPI0019E3CD30|nr:cytochrome c3 family protein [Rhodoferax sp.]MBE0474218.1 cytochrome c3 family protein [Rhodoferax sp.]